MVHHQCLVSDEVPVRQPVHQAVGEGVESIFCPRLRYARPAAAGRRECCDRDVERAAQSGVRRRREIDVELPLIQRVGAKVHEEVGRASRGCGCTVQIGRQHPAKAGTQLEAHLRSGATGDHGKSVIGAQLCAGESVPGENIEGDVIRVRPYSELRVIGKLGSSVAEGVAIVSAGRI